jgi:hypothetical protein
MRFFIKMSLGPLTVPWRAKVSTLLRATVYVTGESGSILTWNSQPGPGGHVAHPSSRRNLPAAVATAS